MAEHALGMLWIGLELLLDGLLWLLEGGGLLLGWGRVAAEGAQAWQEGGGGGAAVPGGSGNGGGPGGSGRRWVGDSCGGGPGWRRGQAVSALLPGQPGGGRGDHLLRGSKEGRPSWCGPSELQLQG